MRSIVSLKNKATESASNMRDRYQSPSSGTLNLPDPYHSRKQAGSPKPPEPHNTAHEDEDAHIDWANLSHEDKEVFFSWLDEFFARYLAGQHPQSQSSMPNLAHQRTSSSASNKTPTSVSTPLLQTDGKKPPQRPPVPATNRWSQATAPTTPPQRQQPPAKAPSPDPEEPEPEEEVPPPPPARSRFTAPPPPVAVKAPPPVAVKPVRPPVPVAVGSPNGPPPAPLGPKPPPVNMASKPARPAITPEPEPELVAEEIEEDDWCIHCRDFSAPDEHATYFPRQKAESVAQLAYDLTAPFEDEVDKARVLFTWFHHNVAYDAANFLAGTVKHGATPEDTLRTGLAVCEGYAGLYQALADAAGLGCLTIGGHSKGYGYQPPRDSRHLIPFSHSHAWNAVWLYDAWRLIEPTWGAGALSNGAYLKRFAPIHFCPGNREFGRKHFPADASHQIIPTPLSWEEYLLIPERAELMGEMEQLGYNEALLRPATRNIPAGNATIVLKRGCNHIPDSEEDAYVPVCLIEWADGRDAPTNHRQHMAALELRDPHIGWTLDVYGLQPTHKLKIALVKVINGKDALGFGRAAFERARGRMGMSWSYLAYWTIV